MEKCNDEDHKAGVVVLNQIKDKFKSSDSKAEKMMLLSLVPKEWGRK